MIELNLSLIIKKPLWIRYRWGQYSLNNYICKTIDSYNKFWKHYLATTIPTDLVLLQQTFFELSLPVAYVTTFFVVFSSIALHFLFTFITVSVSKQCLISYKSLHNIYVRFNDGIDDHLKLKVNHSITF
jgi:integral membrane sensor domain MASE1